MHVKRFSMNRFLEFPRCAGQVPRENRTLEYAQGLIQAAAQGMYLQCMQLEADRAEVDVKDIAAEAIAYGAMLGAGEDLDPTGRVGSLHGDFSGDE
jgi:hypothetical protein